MSRTNQSNNALTPSKSSSSYSDLESSSVQQNFYTVNITFNYSSNPPPLAAPETTLTTISNLIGQQIKDLNKQKRRSQRRSSSKSRSSKPSKEVLFPPEVDALPIVLETNDPTDDVTQNEKEDGEATEIPRMSSIKKSKYSCEYQDLTAFKKPKVRYQLVPSKNVKPVPEDQLPKKRFSTDKKRREYVVLGRLNSLEPVEDSTDEMKTEERKKRSRELARELY